MLDLISIHKIVEAVDGELSQEGNLNAYTKLLILSNKKQVAKVCYKNWDLWHKNITNLQLICNQVSSTDFPEIVLPTALLEHQGDIVGYLMPYIEGNTLDEIINCKLMSTRDILIIFDSVASVIQRLPNNIHLGDLHSRNVIVSNNGTVSLIDIDGFSVDEGYSMTCPLNFYSNIFDNFPISKYFNNDNSVKISKNTDIYCLLEIFLGWLLDGISPFIFSSKRFSLFLEYLTIKGVSPLVVDMFSRIMEKEDNYLISSPFINFEDILASISYEDFICVMNLQKEENKYNQYINQLIEDGRNNG